MSQPHRFKIDLEVRVQLWLYMIQVMKELISCRNNYRKMIQNEPEADASFNFRPQTSLPLKLLKHDVKFISWRGELFFCSLIENVSRFKSVV